MRRRHPLSQTQSIRNRPSRARVTQSTRFEAPRESLAGAGPAGYGRGGIQIGGQIGSRKAQTDDVGDVLTIRKGATQPRCPTCGSSLTTMEPPLPSATPPAPSRPPGFSVARKRGYADQGAGDDGYGAKVSSDHHDDDLLTTAEVADLVRVPPGTIRYWRHIGTGPEGFKVGRHVLYRYQRVREWITAREAA